jgi:hypothetical protein
MGTKNEMLNLIIGKTYEITTYLSDEIYIVTVFGKTVHADMIHSYFMTWPNPGSIHDFGRYFWDHGYSNKGRSIVHSEHGIRTCKEARVISG